MGRSNVATAACRRVPCAAALRAIVMRVRVAARMVASAAVTAAARTYRRAALVPAATSVLMGQAVAPAELSAERAPTVATTTAVATPAHPLPVRGRVTSGCKNARTAASRVVPCVAATKATATRVNIARTVAAQQMTRLSPHQSPATLNARAATNSVRIGACRSARCAAATKATATQANSAQTRVARAKPTANPTALALPTPSHVPTARGVVRAARSVAQA